MVTVREALTFIRQTIDESSMEFVSCADIKGRVLGVDIFAALDQPPFDRVSMDGIAIKYDSFIGGKKDFIIEGVQSAGHAILTLKSEENCIEVMTGAPLPLNTDTVIPYEEIKITGEIASILGTHISRGQNVHRRASDYKKGDLLLKKFAKITPAVVSLIASQGMSKIETIKQKKIAIISTGDELVGLGEELLPHQIYRSNPFALKAQIQYFQNENISLFHLPDEPKIVHEKLQEILSNFDLIILTGGVSKGKFDFLPSVLSDLQVKKIFHGVKQRPGKPMWFGKGPNNQLVFALPGNPVSSLFTLRKYVVGTITGSFEPSFYAILEDDIKLERNFTFFIPAKTTFSSEGKIFAKRLAGNGSGDFSALKESSGFFELEGPGTFAKGSVLPFYHWTF